jgi:hypothetical protein
MLLFAGWILKSGLVNYQMGGRVKISNIIAVVAFVSSLLHCSNAYSENGTSFKDTINLIKETMSTSTSAFRKESYVYIRFNKCSMDYNVLGTYPVGELYDIKFKNIDFSSLNEASSRTGHDYTAFIVLNFDRPFESKGDFREVTLRNAVINVSNDEKAQILFKAFLNLGELCRGAQRPL